MDKQEFIDRYTKHLNDKQLEAVQAVDGAVLLLAVPGSGKTTVLVNRLGYMIYCAGIRPEEILTLTYTVSATQDMSKRFESIFGEELHGRLEFRTINGICAKVIMRCGEMIGQPPFELVSDEGALIRALTDILKKKLDEYPTESEIKGVKSLITYCKNMMLSEDEINALGEEQKLPLLDTYREYNAYLRSNRQMDYDDQMVYGYRLLLKYPDLLAYYRDMYRYICVDEAQDTSKIQHMIIKLLAGDNGNLFMVGDEDQSIYGFRAAYPEALLNFEKDHPGARVLVMDQNYRSNAKIVAAADVFIQHNKARHEKHMVSVRGPEADIRYVDIKKRAGQYSYLMKVADGCTTQTAVLYRDNDSALPLIDQLDRQGIPYRIRSVDMTFFTNRIVSDVTNIMRFAFDPYDTELFMKIYYKCKTYLRKDQAETMCRISREKHIPVLDAAEYSAAINGRIIGNCKGLSTNLKAMLREAPAKAIFRIEKPMGYLEYLERGSIDPGKLFILKQLAYPEASVKSYLARLGQLRNMLKDRPGNYDCPFILSTIHSSKGLEYDRVYLMDVYDGQFPSAVPVQGTATPEDWAQFEEERRLFYVGMTRAKNELVIFRIEEETSRFIREIGDVPGKKAEKKPEDIKVSIKRMPFETVSNEKLKSDFVLVIGERVVHISYGPGTIDDVEYDDKGRAIRFHVEFDSKVGKLFVFPGAFQGGIMKLESGESIPLEPKETLKPVKKTAVASVLQKAKSKRMPGKDSYAYWADKYPDHVVIKKEGYFWTCRGDSARTVSDVLGYRLGGNPGNPTTGSPNLDAMVAGLNRHEVSYVVIEDGEIVDQGDF